MHSFDPMLHPEMRLSDKGKYRDTYKINPRKGSIAHSYLTINKIF